MAGDGSDRHDPTRGHHLGALIRNKYLQTDSGTRIHSGVRATVTAMVVMMRVDGDQYLRHRTSGPIGAT